MRVIGGQSLRGKAIALGAALAVVFVLLLIGWTQRVYLAVVNDPARQPVLVHCEMGVIRTGAMVAAYQVLVEGLDSRQVLQQMPLFGHHLDKRPAIRDFVLGLHRLRS